MIFKGVFFNKTDKKFFTKKRIAIFVISFLIFISLIIVSFIWFKINLIDLFVLVLQNIYTNPKFIFFIFILFTYPITKTIHTLVYIMPRLKKCNVHISLTEYFFLSCKIYIINIITPFSSGSEPYVIYWINTRGGDMAIANSISLINSFWSTLTEFLLTLPSFFYICFFYKNFQQTTLTYTLFWFVLVGVLANFIIIIFYLVLGFSKKTHYYIALFFNFVLSKVSRKKYLKIDLYDKYIMQAKFQKQFKKEIKNISYNFYIILCYFLISFWYYCTIVICIKIIIPNYNLDINNFLILFNIANVCATANNFIPIPGTEGSIQISLVNLISILSNKDINFFQINNAIALWRLAITYLPLIVASLLLGFYYLIKIYKMHKYKKLIIVL